MGDLQSLAESMRELGLLQPISAIDLATSEPEFAEDL
jgi:ParB-like chromosome segregation protein Spo0J